MNISKSIKHRLVDHYLHISGMKDMFRLAEKSDMAEVFYDLDGYDYDEFRFTVEMVSTDQFYIGSYEKPYTNHVTASVRMKGSDDWDNWDEVTIEVDDHEFQDLINTLFNSGK